MHAGLIPEPFGSPGYGTHGCGVHGYRIIPSPPSRHHPGEFGDHPGEFGGTLEQENQQCQCFMYMIMDQGEMPRLGFPDLHRCIHGAPISTCKGGQEQCIVPPTPAVMLSRTASRNYLFVFTGASTRQVPRRCEASWSQRVRKGQRGEGVNGKESKLNASL